MQQQIPWEKIKALEEEIKALKSLGQMKVPKKKLKKDPLYGILKGVTLSEKEIDKGIKGFYNEIFNVDHILYQKHKLNKK